jgi:hypothetical protein
MAADTGLKQLQKRVTVFDAASQKANIFADENNTLTVSSITNGIKEIAYKALNIASIVIIAIFALILLIYIIKTLVYLGSIKKGQKSK